MNEDIKAFLGQAADSVAADEDGSWRTEFVSGMFLPTDTARRDQTISGMTKQPPAIAAATLQAIAQFEGVSALGAVEVPLLSVAPAGPAARPHAPRAPAQRDSTRVKLGRRP